MSNVASIQLDSGAVVILNEEDLGLMEGSRWRVMKPYNTAYAVVRKGERTILMHRLITGVVDPAIHVDHLNGDGLDNRRANLRISTCAENARNRGLNRNNTTGFKGVSRTSHGWCAVIGLNRRSKHLGTFDAPEKAARAYDVAARALHGEFAFLNFPDAACDLIDRTVAPEPDQTPEF